MFNFNAFFFFTLQEELVLPLQSKKSPVNGLCCLTFGLVIFMSGLVLASIYVYRYYFISQVSFRLCMLVLGVVVVMIDKMVKCLILIVNCMPSSLKDVLSDAR